MSDEGHFKCRSVLALADRDIERLTALAHDVFDEMRACLSEAEDSSTYYGGGGADRVAATIAGLERRLAEFPRRVLAAGPKAGG